MPRGSNYGYCGLVWMVVTWTVVPAWADEPSPVRVAIHDGRIFAGLVDRRTDDDRLWLRQHAAGITLARPIAWQSIRGITVGEQSYSADTFRTLYPRWATPAPQIELRPQRTSSPRHLATESIALGRVVALQLDAQLANWDADVEHDGVIVTLLPLDDQGQVIPVDGSVEFELIGEGPGTTARLSSFPSLGRWVKLLRAQEVSTVGARMRLEFQAAHPEFELRLSPYGLIHARLVVPGHGVFAQTSELTTLRTFNPLRDRLQQQTSQRFFPQETTGLGKRSVLPLNGVP